MAIKWTKKELTEAGNMLYDLAWANEEERYRPKRENWVPRVLAGETPIRTDAVVELALQGNRTLAALKESRKWLNYLVGKLYLADKGGVTCSVCHRTFPHNIERNGCTVEHDPEMFCAQAVSAIFASDAAIAACEEK
jgi:hypothetical protein